MNKNILEIRNGTKLFGTKTVFADINISFKYEKVTVIFGPSGCGKTTLLYCLALLKPLDKGSIILDGKKVMEKNISYNEKDVRNKIGIVFQDFFLWDNKNIMNNIIEAPISVLGIPRSEAIRKAQRICKELNINPEIFNQYPSELSRGQRQRIAIARTLIMNPQILLLDEINSSLDSTLTAQLIKIISFLKKQKKTVIVVTHDKEFGKKIGDIFINFSKILT